MPIAHRRAKDRPVARPSEDAAEASVRQFCRATGLRLRFVILYNKNMTRPTIEKIRISRWQLAMALDTLPYQAPLFGVEYGRLGEEIEVA